VHIEHLRIPVGPGHLHAERVGRGGLPIVFLHGFGTCAFLWRHVAPVLANAGYTVLSLDLLGHGESDRSIDGLYGLSAQAEYVDRALTALRVPGAAFVGQDIGCIVALMLAARRPAQRGRLVLLSPPDPGALPPASVRAVQRSSARAAITANEMFGAFPLIRSLLSTGVADASHMTDQLIARYGAPFVGSDGVSHLLMLARSMELENPDQLNLAAVSSSALLVAGELDQWSEAGSMQRLASRLSSANPVVQVMPGVGHLIAEDAPDSLARLLLDWFAVPSLVESVPAAPRSRVRPGERP
jgi:pimeloyl-ACP methyl ester carboxylesterase